MTKQAYSQEWNIYKNIEKGKSGLSVKMVTEFIPLILLPPKTLLKCY